jgi:2,3-dihydroxybiphenyl 1,2-dioxygenase
VHPQGAPVSGVSQLGYLVFAVRDCAAWEAFATGVLGLGVSGRLADGGFALRLDSHRQRILVEPGEADDLAVVGWQVADSAALDALMARLGAAGVAVEEGGAAAAAARQVERLVRLRDPDGIALELFCGPARAAEPFVSPAVRSGFVAEERGLGHLVLAAAAPQASVAFYCEQLGFRVSDRVVTEIYGHSVDIVFLHANRRHHSLAIGGRQKRRIHHFMLEVGAMDDVGLAFDRALAAGVPIMQTLGRHPNDRMFSFYAKTPAGFQFEFGWGGRDIADDDGRPATYDRISEWGHHPPSIFARNR